MKAHNTIPSGGSIVPGEDEGSGAIAVVKAVCLFGLIYLFILSITLLGDSIKLLSSGVVHSIFQSTTNPLVGVSIGMLATAVVQSSSTTTSIIVGLVGSGTLPFEGAIPMVMGANIGTSITNTLVSLGHITRRAEFRRALTGALLHDFFNKCAVAVLLPLQMAFNIIGRTAQWLEGMFAGSAGVTFNSPLAAATKPVSSWILETAGGSSLIGLLLSMVFLFVALRYIVVTLKSIVLTKVEKFFQTYIFRNPALGFILGILLTMAVQSSSITTSLVVPLLGAGVLHPRQIFPYMLGSNIGTTFTAFLAALATGSHAAVSVAFAHLVFNLLGIMVFWPLQAVPIWLARKFAQIATRSRPVVIVYILVVFFALPILIILLNNTR